MKFITTIEHAEAIARKLQKRYPGRITLARCQDMIAAAFGHLDWKDFEGAPRAPLSPFDDEVDAAERKARLNAQSAALTQFGLSSRAATVFVRDVKPSARTPEHDRKISRERSRDRLRDFMDDLKRRPEGLDNQTFRSDPDIEEEDDLAALSTSELMEAITSAYGRGDYDMTTDCFAILLRDHSDLPRRALLDLLAQYVHLDPRAMHHTAILWVTENGHGGSVSQAVVDDARELLFSQMDRFPTDPDQGWVFALLGDIVGGKYGGDPDERSALDYYMQAAGLDVAPAAMAAALIFEGSTDLTNHEMAEHYYRIGAALGMMEAKTNLALLLARARRNGNEVISLLTSAAEAGDEIAKGIIASAMPKGRPFR
jgi:hypothetical protein